MRTPEIQHPTQLLIHLKAAGLNPIDTKLRQRGTFYPQEMPAILGCDGAGVVEAVGAEVTIFKPGDEVYFCAGGLGKAGTGNYAEYTIADQNSVALKPRSLSFAEAAAVASAITPVPGGVGPMTIAVLLRNTVVAARARLGLAAEPGL